MIYARDGDTSEHILAAPGLHAKCPACGDDVIAKCGSIIAWHWAHKSADCDTWAEPESPWHVSWKERFPADWCEVVVGNHRADIKTPSGVIELQHSSIDPYDVYVREGLYTDYCGGLVWILDGTDIWDNLSFRNHNGDYASFRWYWPRKTWWTATSPVFIDLPQISKLFEIKKMHHNTPCGGWGYFRTYDKFMRDMGVGILPKVIDWSGFQT